MSEIHNLLHPNAKDAEILSLVQGSAEWHSERLIARTASEAPAMMSESKYQKRDELLALKKTGVQKEVSDFVQAKFDDGHATEASARAILEAELGIEFFPVVLRFGKYLASMDGLDMWRTVGFEHKLWNETLAEQVRNKKLDPHYEIQLEQQLALSGAEKIIFMCSDGTAEKRVMMEYRAQDGLLERIQRGWDIFNADLEAYTPPVVQAELVGTAISPLPSLNIAVSGGVSSSNIAEFVVAAEKRIAAIKTELKTDQEFADAELAVKYLTDAEKRCSEAEDYIIKQMSSVDDAMKSLRYVRDDLMRVKRLSLEKTIKTQKEAIKASIRATAIADIQALTKVAEDSLNEGHSFGFIRLTGLSYDIDTAMKGARSLTSLKSKVSDEVAKIKANLATLSDRLHSGLTQLKSVAGEFYTLFPDAGSIIHKDAADIDAIAKTRISAHLEALAKADAAKLAAAAAAPAAVAAPTAAPAPRAAAATRAAPESVPAAAPTRDAIIACVAAGFNVTPAVAAKWLADLTNPF